MVVTRVQPKDLQVAVDTARPETTLIIDGTDTYIDLKGRTFVVDSKYHLAIRAEPGPCTLMNGQTTVRRSSLIDLQNLRFSYGETVNLNGLADQLRRSNFGGVRSLVLDDSQDVVVRWCAIRFSSDDNFNVWGSACRRITLADSLIYGGLAPHRKAVLIGTSERSYDGCVFDDFYVRIRRCLLTWFDYRGFKAQGGNIDFSENVVAGYTLGGELYFFRGDVVNNVFVPSGLCRTTPLVAVNAGMLPVGLYVAGNHVAPASGQARTSLPEMAVDQWTAVVGLPRADSPARAALPVDFRSPVSFFGGNRMSAANAYDHVISRAGPTRRDQMDLAAVGFANNLCTGKY